MKSHTDNNSNQIFKDTLPQCVCLAAAKLCNRDSRLATNCTQANAKRDKVATACKKKFDLYQQRAATAHLTVYIAIRYEDVMYVGMYFTSMYARMSDKLRV